jgi:hypothetical protein
MKTYVNGEYIEMTEEEILEIEEQKPSPEQQILELKQMLDDTDYQAIKYAEGWFTDEEYASVKAQRQAWRDEINRLELEIKENSWMLYA